MENTTTSPAHTPTPWRSFQVGGKHVIRCDAKDTTIGVTSGWDPRYHAAEEAANAAFIVRACNIHAELITALKDALCALDVAKSRDPGQAGIYHCPLARRVIAQAEAC